MTLKSNAEALALIAQEIRADVIGRSVPLAVKQGSSQP